MWLELQPGLLLVLCYYRDLINNSTEQFNLHRLSMNTEACMDSATCSKENNPTEAAYRPPPRILYSCFKQNYWKVSISHAVKNSGALKDLVIHRGQYKFRSFVTPVSRMRALCKFDQNLLNQVILGFLFTCQYQFHSPLKLPQLYVPWDSSERSRCQSHTGRALQWSSLPLLLPPLTSHMDIITTSFQISGRKEIKCMVNINNL